MLIKFRKYIETNSSQWLVSLSAYPFFYLGVAGMALLMSMLIESSSTHYHVQNILAACTVFTVLSLLGYLATEAFGSMQKWKYGFQAVALLAGVLLFLVLPNEDNALRKDLILSSSLILLAGLVSVSFWMSWKKASHYYIFNANFFYRLLSAILLCLLLWSLLSLSIYAFNELFEINSGKYKIYGHLFVWLMTVLCSLMFWSKHNKEEWADASFGYGPVNRTLLSFVMIPVVGVYALLLISFYVKNIFTGLADEDWLQNLSIWYIILSGLTWLLSSEDLNGEHYFLKLYRKWWPYVTSPIVLGLTLATAGKISMWGIGLENYFRALFIPFAWAALVLIWLRRSEYLLPVVICSLTIISVLAGPFRAWTLSNNNLQKRIVGQLEQAGLIQNGKLQASNVNSEVSEVLEDQLYELESRDLINFLSAYDTGGSFFKSGEVNAREILNRVKISSTYSGSSDELVSRYVDILPEIATKDGERIIPLVHEGADHQTFPNKVIIGFKNLELYIGNKKVGEQVLTDESLRLFPEVSLDFPPYSVRLFIRNYSASKGSNGVHSGFYLDGVALLTGPSENKE